MKINVKKLVCTAMAASFLGLTSCAEAVEKAGFQAPVPTSPVTTAPPVTETEPSTTVTPTVPVDSYASASPDVMRGNLYDVNGEVLMYSSRNESGKEVRMTNDSNKVAFANVLNEMSEGYDMVFDDYLRTPNPSPVNGDEKVGRSVRITLDADVQNAIYDYMASVNLVGTAVVLRSDGSILAQVSYPSYDPDLFYGVKTEEDLAWGTYGNKAFQNFPPGSCFKIMSEVISDKHGVYSLYDEGEWEFDGVSIVNWDHDTNGGYPMQRSLYSAFVNSSNIFFARSFDTIGIEPVLTDLNEIFHFGKDINCDFGVIHNNIEIYCQDDLRRTAFGQSYILTCPIYLAALGREAAFGEMVKPYAIESIVDTNDPSAQLSPGSSTEVIAAIPQDYRQNLLDGMSGVASGLAVSVPAGYRFYAKTGTAETWENDFLYITGFMKRDSDDGYGPYDHTNYDGSYIIAMQVRNPGSFGYDFASKSAPLYQGILNCIFNN